MKYRQEERMEIGRKIYVKELKMAVAAKKYGINLYTARDYYRVYKAALELRHNKEKKESTIAVTDRTLPEYREELYRLPKEELVDMLVRAKVAEVQAKINLTKKRNRTRKLNAMKKELP